MDKNQCRHLEITEKYNENEECLSKLMNLQKTLQETTYGYNFESLRENLGTLHDFISWNESALQDELREMYEALGGVDSHSSAIWKPWKSKHQEARAKPFSDLTPAEKKELQMELVDIQHFLFNMMLACDMTPELLYEYYVSKNKENIRRQLNNY